jgi:hypothetical protein
MVRVGRRRWRRVDPAPDDSRVIDPELYSRILTIRGMLILSNVSSFLA